MKVKNFIIGYTVYPFDVMVSVGETDEQLFKKLKSKGIDKNLEDCSLEGKRGRCVMFEGGQTLIRLKGLPKNCEDYGTIAHEIFHAVAFLFNRIGIKLSMESDEAFAYAIEFLTKKIYEKI